MKKIIKNKEFKRPSVTTFSTPVYHRLRRDWRDDQYLIEEISKNTNKENWRKLNSIHRIRGFKGLVSKIESLGYQSNDDAYALAMWIREELSKLASEKGGYDLRLHAFTFPPRIADFIAQRCKASLSTQTKLSTQIPIETLFPDPQTKEYVLERVRLLHKGNLISYLNYLVANERTSLNGDSAKIFDLIQICQEKLKRRNLKSCFKFHCQ